MITTIIKSGKKVMIEYIDLDVDFEMKNEDLNYESLTFTAKNVTFQFALTKNLEPDHRGGCKYYFYSNDTF